MPRLERRAARVDRPGGASWVLVDQDDEGSNLRLPPGTSLAGLVGGGLDAAVRGGERVPSEPDAELLAPVDDYTEVWAAGVTYELSRDARMDESATPDVYQRVYDSPRPELFFKSLGWRVSGPGRPIAVRPDSDWDVPEPELAVVLDPYGEIFGWTICNDVSSRSIEGDNPLYLPQAKVYLGGCALGPAIVLAGSVPDPYDLSIELRIDRDGASFWTGRASTSQLRRRVGELASYLFRADRFPDGVVLSTGTCLVPGDGFSLQPGDVVRIAISGLGELVNPVGPTLTDSSSSSHLQGRESR